SPNDGPGSFLLSVAAVSAGNVWAVGGSSSTASAVFEHWDGSAWSLMPGPGGVKSNSLSGVAATPNGGLWAVGDYQGSDLLSHTLTEQYTDPCATPASSATPSPTPICGLVWSVVSSPNAPSSTDSELFGMGAMSTS